MGTLHGANYPAARSLAGHLRPQGLTAQADPDGMRKVSEQIGQILSGMQDSQVTGGPGADDLLQTAYKFFVPQVGPTHRNAAVGSLTAMWEEARALGAFDDKNKFTGKITKGPDTGKACVFEYIVPMKEAPQFSRDVANVRLVAPSRKRVDGEAPTPRELAYVNALKAVEREVSGLKTIAKIADGPKTNAVGQTVKEAEEKWKEAMKRDGDKALQKPSILLQSRLLATPSKRSDYKWVVQAELVNMSPFATEVSVQCIFIGTTDKYRKNYVMGEPTKKVQLRGGQAEKVTFETPMNEGAYKGRTDDYEQLTKPERAKSRVFYRGALVRVIHAKGDVTAYASDPVMLDLLKEESDVKLDMLPKLHLDQKQWPKFTPSN